MKEVSKQLKEYETKQNLEEQKFQENKKWNQNNAGKKKDDLQKEYDKCKQQSATAGNTLSLSLSHALARGVLSI